jgi:hypothetical protein
MMWMMVTHHWQGRRICTWWRKENLQLRDDSIKLQQVAETMTEEEEGAEEEAVDTIAVEVVAADPMVRISRPMVNGMTSVLRTLLSIHGIRIRRLHLHLRRRLHTSKTSNSDRPVHFQCRRTLHSRRRQFRLYLEPCSISMLSNPNNGRNNNINMAVTRGINMVGPRHSRKCPCHRLDPISILPFLRPCDSISNSRVSVGRYFWMQCSMRSR